LYDISGIEDVAVNVQAEVLNDRACLIKACVFVVLACLVEICKGKK
jgi:hypothetical protein